MKKIPRSPRPASGRGVGGEGLERTRLFSSQKNHHSLFPSEFIDLVFNLNLVLRREYEAKPSKIEGAN
jgi:hypothetical protein